MILSLLKWGTQDCAQDSRWDKRLVSWFWTLSSQSGPGSANNRLPSFPMEAMEIKGSQTLKRWTSQTLLSYVRLSTSEKHQTSQYCMSCSGKREFSHLKLFENPSQTITKALLQLQRSRDHIERCLEAMNKHWGLQEEEKHGEKENRDKMFGLKAINTPHSLQPVRECSLRSRQRGSRKRDHKGGC